MTEITSLPSNTFGVELEVSQYIFRNESIVEDLNRELVREHGTKGHLAESEGDSDGSIWDVKGDGSCGGEIASPALDWSTVGELCTVTNFLQSEGYDAGPDCGLHVHHHFPDLDAQEMRRLWLAWAAFEPLLFAMVHSRRAVNNYCNWMLVANNEDDYCDDPECDCGGGSDTRSGWNEVVEGMTPATRFKRFVNGRGRYVGLNFTKWWYTGTVEVRIHQGTLDADEILDWVKFTQLFLHAMRKDLRIQDLTDIHNLSTKDKFWALHRLMSERVKISEFPVLWDRMVERINTYNPRILQDIRVSSTEPTHA